MMELQRRQTATATATSPTTTSNSVATSLSIPDAGLRIDHCSIVRDSILYIFGGQQISSSSSNSSSFPLFASLNLTTLSNSQNLPTWQEMPSTNAVPVLNPQCVLTDTHLLVVGGQPTDPDKVDPFASSATITYGGLQAFSFAENAWQSLLPAGGLDQFVPINLNRTGHTASWLTDVGNGSPGLFVMGGIHFNATVPSNDAFIFNPFTIPAIGGQAIIGTSSIANPAPPPLWNSGSAIVDGGTSVIVFGGKNLQTQEIPTSIWEYSPKTQVWTTLPVSLPQGMPNVQTGWVDSQSSLVVVDISTANTGNDASVVPLAGLTKRQSSSPATTPSKMNGYSVTFDTNQNMAIVTGGDGANESQMNMFNVSNQQWSVFNIQHNVQTPLLTSSITPTTTTLSTSSSFAISSAAPTVSLSPTNTNATLQQPQSTGFNKSNLLAPIILGSVLGALGLVGLVLLIIAYRRNKRTKKSQHTSISPAGLWLKYGNRRDRPPQIGGEIFLRNLEEKHGLKRGNSERGRTGWSKYFSTGWYNNRVSAGSTSTTARALVNETRHHTGPYGGGWDAESQYSKPESYMSGSVYSVGKGEERGEERQSTTSHRWSDRFRWSLVNKKTRQSARSSGVLGNTVEMHQHPNRI